VPMNVHGTVVTVEAMVNGKGPFLFAVDTGAESCSVLPRVWEAVGARAEYRVELMSTAGGAKVVPASKQFRFEVGGATASRVETLVHDLPAVRAVVPGVDGVLGQSFLANFDYLIDYTERQVVFGARLEGARLPLKRLDHRLVVRANAGRRGVDLVLDSGASNLVLRSAAPFSGSNAFLMGNTGSQVVTRGRIQKLTVGETVLHNLETAYLPSGSGADGLLPTALFSRIYINNREDYVVLGVK
ncbi:MAG: retropepsin-like aspartic protease, partial [Acidobacteria bacterium]|nr:retropepsin-like aspartic protease [Acidobacteriota bacterium]